MQTAQVSPAQVILLLWGDWTAARERAEADGTSLWELFVNDRHRHAWRAIEADALREWVKFDPGTRPESWWLYSAPELRRVSGSFTQLPGAQRCQSTGVPYGEPDWGDPPMVESQPEYLDRLNLWLPGERARVPAADFASQRFASWDLTVQARGTPEEWNETSSDHDVQETGGKC